MTKLMVVDDSLSVRKAIEILFSGGEYSVFCAQNGLTAIHALESERPDLIICDLVLPDIDGFKVFEAIRARPYLAETPVIFMTGIVNDEVRQRAAHLGAGALMKKPFNGDELIQKVASLVQTSRRSASETPDRNSGPTQRNTVLNRIPAEALVLLDQLKNLPEMKSGLLLTPDAKVLATFGESRASIQEVALRASQILRLATFLSSGLGHETLQGLTLEAREGLCVIHQILPDVLLLLVIKSAAALGKTRYHIKKLCTALSRGARMQAAGNDSTRHSPPGRLSSTPVPASSQP